MLLGHLPLVPTWRTALEKVFSHELGTLPHCWKNGNPDPARPETWKPLLQELASNELGLNGLTYAFLTRVANAQDSPVTGPSEPLNFPLPDRFQLEESIGKGGFGIVYRATDRQSSQPVAIKRFHPKLSESIRLALLQSNTRLRDLSSRPDFPCSLCRVGEIIEMGGEMTVLMEYFEGLGAERNFDLFDWFFERRDRPFTPDEIGRIAERVAHGALYLFENGLYHPDISLENVLIRGDGSVALGDYDLLLREGEEASFPLNGVPDYWAPEQWRLDCIAGESTIVWTLGILIYELSVMRRVLIAGPFSYEKLIASWHRTMKQFLQREMRRRVPPDFHPDLVRLALSATAFDPKERPSLGELHRQLAGFK